MSDKESKTVYFVNVSPKQCILEYQEIARLADECLDIFIGKTDEGKISVGFDVESNAKAFATIIGGYAKPKRTRKAKKPENQNPPAS